MAICILYHDNCPDGFGAAYAAWKKYGDTATYIPVRHGNPPPDMPPGSEVYIIDFAYSRTTLETLAAAHTLQVLDHHKTAEEDLRGLPFAHFDMHKSGAVLAWEYFHPGTEVPLLLQYVQDQDIWTWKLPEAQEVCTALNLYAFDFEVWDQLSVETLTQEGRVALRFKQQLVERLCEKAEMLNFAGHTVPVVNTPLFASEVGNELCLRHPEADFAACYSQQGEVRKWSLRSVGDFDVSAVAKPFGGGGHRNASGCTTPAEIVQIV
jgi:hypothetical protein